MMGLLAEAKKRKKEKLNKQFISFYDSVLYLGEPKDEALEFVLNNLRNKQTHLMLEYSELFLINIQRYQDDPDEYYCFTDDFISKHLTECVKAGYIDESNPIYNLGFAKKSFIEMLVCFRLPVSESEQRTAQSPDLAFNDEHFEVDYYTYEMIVNERDELRERLENQQPQTDSHLSQQLQATIDRQAKQIAELEAQIAEQQKTIEQLTQQAGAPADDDPLFDELDKRTQSNFVRLFIALNELANAKKGGISLDKSYNTEHNAQINAALDRLGYSQIGEAAYKTLIDLIKEKRQKGL